MLIVLLSFQYHTFLHHSQTVVEEDGKSKTFQYHTFLHHSQTGTNCVNSSSLFQYHTFLHHSQTGYWSYLPSDRFQYHTFLHHSQTWGAVCACCWGFSTIHFYIILKPQIQKRTAIICAKQGTQTHLIDFTLISIYNIP